MSAGFTDVNLQSDKLMATNLTSSLLLQPLLDLTAYIFRHECKCLLNVALLE